MASVEETLAEVDRRIAEGGLRLVAARTERALLKDRGIPAAEVEENIHDLAETLDAMVEYRQLLLAALERREK